MSVTYPSESVGSDFIPQERWVDLYPWFADFGQLENELSLPEGFVSALVDEDDWSFIIKAQAVIESAVTQVVTRKLDTRLEPLIARLPFSAGKTTKLGFVRALGLLPDEVCILIDRISELRNSLVHDPTRLSFDFRHFVLHMDTKDRRRLAGVLAAVIAPDDNELGELALEVLNREPKGAVGLGVLAVLGHCLFAIHPDQQQLTEERITSATPAILAFVLVVAALVALADRVRKQASDDQTLPSDAEPQSPG